MTTNEQKELRGYCAYVLSEYGFDLSPENPVIPALYIIHQEVKLNHERNKELVSEVRQAAAQINPQVFNFHSDNGGFYFQIGIAVKWLLIGGLLLCFVMAALWYWSRLNDVYEARTIIDVSGQFGDMIKRVKRDEDGYLFLDFIEAKRDSIQTFKEFQKLDAKTVRVYLGKASK